WKAAVFYSLVFSVTIIGEGYDLALMGNFFSLRQFQSLFGVEPAPGKAPEIPALWQSLIQCAALLGQVCAIYLTGHCVDRFGYRRTVLIALGSVLVFLFVPFFSTQAIGTAGSNGGLGVLLAGEFLLGMPWGVFQATTLPYASEVAPVKLRPTLTTFVNMCWILGQLLATGATKAVTRLDNFAAFRIPVAVQWTWPVPVALFVYLAPESPWWFVRHGRSREALESIRRLNNDRDFPAEGQLRILELTNAHERDADRTSCGQYLDCFKATNRRRTEVVVMLNLTQQLCGSCLMYYSAKLYQKGGIKPENAFDYTLVQYGLGIVAISFSWLLMRYFGRRRIWISGLTLSTILLSGVGFLGFFIGHHPAIPWAIAALLIFFTAVYNLSIGPLTYSLVSEMPSTRLKAKTIVIGRCSYLIAGLFNLFLTPKMLEDIPNGWGLGPRAALVFAGLNMVFLTWAWFRLPETKGRSFAEIDELFQRKTLARRFKTTILSEP
ncbi:general substrate transporter, partial [Sodiomyces alkalinus F11]